MPEPARPQWLPLLGRLLGLRVVIAPHHRQPVQIPADAELHRGALERIAERGLRLVAAVRLTAFPASVFLGHRDVADPDAEPAGDRVAGQDDVFVRVAGDPDDGTQAITGLTFRRWFHSAAGVPSKYTANDASQCSPA